MAVFAFPHLVRSSHHQCSFFKPLLLVFLTLFLLLLPLGIAQEPDLQSAAVQEATPQEVQVGLYVLNLGRFDIATGSFTADFYLSMTCKEECITPSFEFMNGRATSIDKMIDLPNEKFYRIQASLASPVDLRRFPFDKQQMQIILEDKLSSAEHIRYVPNPEQSGIDESIIFTGWKIIGYEAAEHLHYYPVYDESYSQYVFTIFIEKITFNSFLKTLLPIIFILLVVLSSYVIDPDKIANRLTIAGSGLLAAVMFHVSISNQLPPVSYLTFADKFMILTYFVLVLTFVINIILWDLQELKKTELVEKIHRSTEYTMFGVVPLLYLLLFLFFL
ncbi:MAG: hypothetical protein QW594_00165 [Candidatus Woesearchaeota archaeon]